MTNREILQSKLRQMFWDGRLSTDKFDLFTPEGRDKASEHFATLLGPDVTLDQVTRGFGS